MQNALLEADSKIVGVTVIMNQAVCEMNHPRRALRNFSTCLNVATEIIGDKPDLVGRTRNDGNVILRVIPLIEIQV
ncbi:MAG: hypothetical protein EBT50_03750 [Verrucomicrobia bacterium]|nr:hypothetical protein [Verrucomicrobiota bacterium]